MSKLGLSILITVVGWLIGSVIYGYFWVNNILETEPLYGYERSRLLIATGYLVYRVPYLLMALVVLIVLELLFVPRPHRERMS
jgi:hypothetical protein